MSTKDWFGGLNVIDEEEREMSRCYWRRLGVIVLIAGIVLYAAKSAFAETVIPTHVIEHDAVKMRMLPTACADPTSLMLAIQLSPPQYHARWKATSSDWRMKDGSWQTFPGCWLEVSRDEVGAPDDVFFFVFSDGATGQVLKGELLKPKGMGA